MQRAVLGEALEVISALDHVEGDVRAVAAAEGVAGQVEVEPPGVAAPLGEDFEPSGSGMIAPDRLLELVAADPR